MQYLVMCIGRKEGQGINKQLTRVHSFLYTDDNKSVIYAIVGLPVINRIVIDLLQHFKFSVESSVKTSVSLGFWKTCPRGSCFEASAGAHS